MSNDFNQPFKNPYEVASGAQEPPFTPQETKPTSMTVFGILNLVFGSFAILGVVFLIVSHFVALPDEPEGDNPIAEVMKSPSYQKATIVMQFISFPLAIVLLFSGIGLLQGKSYGRTLGIFYGVAAIFMAIGGAAVNLLLITLPMMEQAAELESGPKEIMIASAIILPFFSACGLIYPILLLIFLNRAPVVNYLRAKDQ
ncbi:MAG: hypothetical protein IT423_09495 [Pirellulaceae bacterium]|nr:hypothetical protein [Pirellulaceae bacterium]